MIVYKLLHIIELICDKLLLQYWQFYQLRYCLNHGVCFQDKNNVHFYGRSVIDISRKSTCFIGNDFIVNSGPLFGIGDSMSKIIVKEGSQLSIGNSSGISSTTILCNESITIGDFVNVGAGTMINDSNHHSIDWKVREDRALDQLKAQKAPIVIGDYVFIGARCIINKGVTIGPKTIIASGSVVVKDIPGNCIAGGNPCKVIKEL